jgi:glycosyltransferase involved in cell wall biosynthesis
MIVPIIMQTHNRAEYTANTIMGIHNNILYPKHLIVIDNGSTDCTPDFLLFAKAQGFIDELILNPENKGIAEPKNQGLELVKKLSEKQQIKYVCITDNDIVPPFIRDKGCALEHIVKLMDTNSNVGMCGVDLMRDNAPTNQEWWWRLRQHPNTIPEFAEISIGFWFSVIRYEYFKDFSFKSGSQYGRVDESIRNYITLVKKAKVGLLKGYYDSVKKETISRCGIHLGWTEDQSKYPQYVMFKKQERAKAEKEWKDNNRKW